LGSSNKIGALGGADMFIKTAISGLDICMLVTTRATLSVVPKGIYDKAIHKDSSLNVIERGEKPVLSANSEPLYVSGKLKMPISIDNSRLQLQTFL
jgi:hypothetical protein